MTIEEAIELLTTYRNGWIDSELFDLSQVDEARQVTHNAGYEWAHGYDSSLGGGPLGWKLIKSENN
jgi:hypothetical protein